MYGETQVVHAPVISKPLGVSGPNLLYGLVQYIFCQQLVHDPIHKA